MTPALQLTSAELPALYHAADAASLRGQRSYLRLIRYDLLALVFGAALSSYTPAQSEQARWVYAFSALLMVVGFLLTVVVMQKQFEQSWYGGRAAAESVKSLAWRYATRAEPFHDAKTESEARRSLVGALRSVLEQSNQLRISLAGQSGTHQQETAAMATLRAASLEERKAVYMRDRVEHQCKWYSDKAEFNRRRERNYFLFTIACQLGAVAYAIALVARPSMGVNATGALTTAAAAFLVWLQARQHQELAQSYSVTANELGLIAVQAQEEMDERQFAAFVGDAETAISREHTLWVARRDHLPRLNRL